MITPIITSLTREVFATTPVSLKEASYGLGATRWEMIRGAVFPHSRGGVTSAVMIGLGRAIGETIAVALLIGSSQHISEHIFGPGDTLASIIANQFGEATGIQRAALIGMGVVLFVLTVGVGVLARGIVSRYDRRAGAVRMTAVASPAASRPPPKSRSRKVKSFVATCLIALDVPGRDGAARVPDRVRRAAGQQGVQLGLPHRATRPSRTACPAAAWTRRSSARCSSPAPRRSWPSRSASSAASYFEISKQQDCWVFIYICDYV